MVKVAVTQQEPLWFDLEGTVDKTCRMIEEAGSNGAKLIAFPEVWACGHPLWIWARAVDPPLATAYIKSSMSYGSPQMARICAAAKENAIAVSLGFSENENDSLYIVQCIISAGGEILKKRRKLKPTHVERTVFGDAGGQSLNNVVKVEGLGKVVALNCFEHTQPLLKYHTISQGERIHVASWPPVAPYDNSPASQGIQSLSQTYAMESATFVLHCTSVLSASGINAMKTNETSLFDKPGGGYSAVFGPDGRLTEPIPADQEGIVYADLPMDFATTVRHFMDVAGHYSRPDLLWLGVDAREKKCVRAVGEQENSWEKL